MLLESPDMILADVISGAPLLAPRGAGRLSLFVYALGHLFRGAATALAEYRCRGAWILRFFRPVIFAVSFSRPVPSTTSCSTTDHPLLRCCTTCQQSRDYPNSYHDASLVTADDVAKVFDQLGLTWHDDDGEDAKEMPDTETNGDLALFTCRDCRMRGAALNLLEEKEAGEQELREAFAVFDANRDGYITPMELWMVMRRLELKEGMMLEECRRMVEAFDQDGDGRISFAEFRRLLETAC